MFAVKARLVEEAIVVRLLKGHALLLLDDVDLCGGEVFGRISVENHLERQYRDDLMMNRPLGELRGLVMRRGAGRRQH